MMFIFKCCGCWTTEIDYKSSQLAQNSRRQIVSLALSLAFFISGHGYASYRKTLGRGLGLGVTSEKPFLEVIDLALPHIKDMLDEMCDDAKHQMIQLPSDQIGSWSRAVTCCDGCWLLRGHFSQNCTFVIKNYITGALLYYGHLSMRGADRICDEDLWQGTAKSAEGHLSQKLWAQAKEEGLNVAINWQDADSSSAKGFRYSFSNEQESRVMLCGGHVGRAHGKKLEDLKGMSTFTPGFIALHKSEFPSIESLKCCCAGKKHTFVATRNKPVCGCIGPGFIQNAKQNHYCALVQAGNSPEKYRETMLTLGKYHSKDIHEWEGGSCSFHPLTKCSCKNCDCDENGFYPDMKCQGQPYHSTHPLKCEFHGLAYEIECAERAKNAKSVIDPELGKGHSNMPEATFSVLAKFRAKDTNLHQKHYQASTNLGLIQANMTWLFKEKGAQYHWIIELYSRMGLPVLSGIQEICQHDNRERMKLLEYYKTDAGKKKRVKRKVNRAEEQELRYN
ncbi:uncharacterized protein [Montipora foliosa]|uniref:uncharacterized protein n=1 Tax=Montipora foliosa TaxID=591990 RepID=UPI0035F1AA09